MNRRACLIIAIVSVAARQHAGANRSTDIDVPIGKIIISNEYIRGRKLDHGECFDCNQNNPCGPSLQIENSYYYGHCNSSRFIHCSDHGQCYTNYCAVGTVWDQNLRMCTLKLSVPNSTPQATTMPPPNTTPQATTMPLPNTTPQATTMPLPITTKHATTMPPANNNDQIRAQLPPNTIPSATTATQSSCGLSVEDRKNKMKKILETISDPVHLYSPGTPQNMALHWIVHKDKFQACPDDVNFIQRYILAVFYHSTGGGSWNECNAPVNDDIAQANSECYIIAQGTDPYHVPTISGSDAWLTPSHECLWGGVACAEDTMAIDRIEFENDGLSGTLPSELSNLSELRYLIIEEGKTGGSIPSEYGMLEKLIVFDLNYNVLQGPIPEEIYTGLHNLMQLDLNDNLLTGSISSTVSNLQYLDFLQLENNNLSGTIPEALGLISDLRVLELYNNDFISNMPEILCRNRARGLMKLTADCKASPVPEVYCPVPTCCTACPS